MNLNKIFDGRYDITHDEQHVGILLRYTGGWLATTDISLPSLTIIGKTEDEVLKKFEQAFLEGKWDDAQTLRGR